MSKGKGRLERDLCRGCGWRGGVCYSCRVFGGGWIILLKAFFWLVMFLDSGFDSVFIVLCCEFKDVCYIVLLGYY